MKFIRKIFVIFCFITITLIGTVLAETGTVNVSATRLRKENNTDSDIITNIYEGDKVEILGEAGEWYQVKYDGNTGYVKKEYLTVKKSEEKNTNTVSNTAKNNTTNNVSNTESRKNTVVNNTNTEKTNTTNNVENNNTNVNENNIDGVKVTTNSPAILRNIPSMISQSIAQIEQSKQLTKISEMGNWMQVTDGIVTGWISKSKVILTNTEPVESSNFTESSNQNQAVNNTTQNISNTATNTTNSTKTNTTNTNTNTSTSNETSVNKTGIINVETAKVRETASSSAKVTEFLDYNDKVTIVAEDGEWYKITSSKASGYVNKRLITVSSENETISSRSLEENRNIDKDDTVVNQDANTALNNSFSNTNAGNDVAEYAKQYLGYSYVVGGKTPNSGFDCSGFTRYVYMNFGYTLGTTASNQTNVGTEISREDLQIGDLILFYNEGKTSIGHTGIYIGNNEFIHAANPQRGVVTDNLNTNSYYNERFVSARRIVN